MFIRKLLSRLGVPPRPRDPGNMSSGAVIGYEELKELIATGSLRLFDVRSPAEVQGGKIPTSVNIPVDEVEEALKMDAAAFRQKYNAEKPDRDERNIVFHCQVGRRGQRATDIALGLGYQNARNYLGAYTEWSQKEKK